MVLSECDPGALASIRLNVAGSWFVSFSVLFLYGVIMIPVCRQLHSVAGQMMAKAVTFVHMGLMVFLGILLLAALAVATSITEQRLSSRYGYSIFALADAQRGLYITYDVFAVIAMGSAAISMVLALSRKVQLRTRVSCSYP